MVHTECPHYVSHQLCRWATINNGIPSRATPMRCQQCFDRGGPAFGREPTDAYRREVFLRDHKELFSSINLKVISRQGAKYLVKYDQAIADAWMPAKAAHPNMTVLLVGSSVGLPTSHDHDFGIWGVDRVPKEVPTEICGLRCDVFLTARPHPLSIAYDWTTRTLITYPWVKFTLDPASDVDHVVYADYDQVFFESAMELARRPTLPRSVPLPQYDRIAAKAEICDACPDLINFAYEPGYKFSMVAVCGKCKCPSGRLHLPVTNCPEGKHDNVHTQYYPRNGSHNLDPV